MLDTISTGGECDEVVYEKMYRKKDEDRAVISFPVTQNPKEVTRQMDPVFVLSLFIIALAVLAVKS